MAGSASAGRNKVIKPERGVHSRGIQSIEVGMAVIEALAAAGGPMTLKDLSAATRMAPSSCHRYLSSFVRTGFVTQIAGSGRYDLGPRTMHAGLRALARVDAMAVGLAACDQLMLETGSTVQLAMWSDYGPVIVAWRLGSKAIRTNVAVGSPLPILATATGRVFLSYLPEARTTAALRAEGGDRKSADGLIRSVRAKGYALIKGGFVPGLSAAASAIQDCNGEAALVIAVLGLADGIPSSAIASLLRIAGAASSNLGWSGADIAPDSKRN